VQIDSIEQWTGDALTVTLHLDWAAAAFALEIGEVTAGAGIHCGNEHELGGKRDTPSRARHSNFPILKRLAHYLQRRSFKLRQFIQKQDAIVREAYFARIWKRPAAKQTDVADRVMGRAERSRRDKRLFGIEQTSNAMYFGRFDRFIECKRRDDCRDPLGQH